MLSYEMINYIIWKESRSNCFPAFKLRLFYHHGFLQIEVSATFDKSFCAINISLSGLQCVYLSVERCLGKTYEDWRVTLALRIICANNEKKFGFKDRHEIPFGHPLHHNFEGNKALVQGLEHLVYFWTPSKQSILKVSCPWTLQQNSEIWLLVGLRPSLYSNISYKSVVLALVAKFCGSWTFPSTSQLVHSSK